MLSGKKGWRVQTDYEQGRTGYPCDTMYGAYEKGVERAESTPRERPPWLDDVCDIVGVTITWWPLIDPIYRDGTNKVLGGMTGRVHRVVRCSYEVEQVNHIDSHGR